MHLMDGGMLGDVRTLGTYHTGDLRARVQRIRRCEFRVLGSQNEFRRGNTAVCFITWKTQTTKTEADTTKNLGGFIIN